MMTLTIIALVLQGSVPPPPVLNVFQAEPAPAVEWSCIISRRAGPSFPVSGSFPPVSLDMQKTGGAFHLQSTIKSSQEPFNGTFNAALTSPLPLARRYSIAVGQLDGKAFAYIMSFQFYPNSHDGFVTVSSTTASAGGTLAAYAAGLCEIKDQR